MPGNTPAPTNTHAHYTHTYVRTYKDTTHTHTHTQEQKFCHNDDDDGDRDDGEEVVDDGDWSTDEEDSVLRANAQEDATIYHQLFGPRVEQGRVLFPSRGSPIGSTRAAAVPAQERKVCVMCGVATRKKCGRCRSERYCSEHCQVVGWPAHKVNCFSQRYYMKYLLPEIAAE